MAKKHPTSTSITQNRELGPHNLFLSVAAMFYTPRHFSKAKKSKKTSTLNQRLVPAKILEDKPGQKIICN